MSDTTCVYPACMGHIIPGCQGPCKKPFVGRIPRQDAQFPTPAPLDGAMKVPTEAQIASACMSYDHSFGLMDGPQRVALMHQAREWLYAWQKELAALRGIGGGND